MYSLKIFIILALFSVSLIAQEYPSKKDFHNGVGIINSHGRAGKIVGIYQDGDIAVRFSILSKRYKWPISQLAIRTGCTQDHYCVGDRVVNGTGYSGTIKGIFQSGDVAVSFSRFISFPGRSRFYIYSTSNLALRDN